MSSKEYFIYVRKSSESEERQELSIPAQVRELTTFSERRGFKLVAPPFEESMSAKRPGRPVFGKLLEALQRRGAAGIICWKLDRLARNPVDGGQLIYAVGEGQIAEIATPDRVFSGAPDDKFLMSLEFGMATKYSDDLSQNVRRGNREALQQGRWPGYPKLGYVRDHATMRLVPDPERHDQIRMMWQFLLQGRSPLDILALANKTWGFTTPRHGRQGGRPLSKAAIYRMFRDEFYVGWMVRSTERHRGSHPPLVTRDEFDQAQALLNRRLRTTARPKNLVFAYRGLIHCGSCDSLVTAKHLYKRNGRHYIYYHCYRKERRYRFCPEPSLQEGAIEKTFEEFIGSLVLPPNWSNALVELFERIQNNADKYNRQTKERLEREGVVIEGRLGRLKTLYLDGGIPLDEYNDDRAKMERELEAIEDRIRQHVAPATYLKPQFAALSTLKQAPELFRLATLEEKRRMVAERTCYVQLKDKSLLIQASEAYNIFANWRSFPTLSAWLDHVETPMNSIQPETEQRNITCRRAV